MRVISLISLSAAVGAMVLLPAGLLFRPTPRTGIDSSPCRSRMAVAYAGSESEGRPAARPLPAGDAPAFLLASVQPIKAPEAWRTIYHEVERCAGMVGDY